MLNSTPTTNTGLNWPTLPLSATEKAATALELARQEQERIRLEIKRTMQRYSENLEEAKKRS